jgi:CRP/FNR family cyclic AMP-dependent transcriptional regulator
MRKVLYLFGLLSDDDVEWVIGAGRPQRVAAGVTLIQEDQYIETLYLVLDGLLVVTSRAAGEVEIARLSAGEIVGEISLVDSRPPSATVTAVRESLVLAISRARLSEQLERDANFSAHFYRAVAVFLAHRLRATTGQLGYGSARPLASEAEAEGDLDPALLDTLHLAGARFDRLLKRTAAEADR